MGWFSKEEKVHVVRDPDTGDVVRLERSGDVEKKPRYESVDVDGETYTRGGTPISDKLQEQYYRKHPKEKKSGMREKFVSAAKRIDRGIVKYNRSRNPMRGNYNPFGSMFDSGMGRRSASSYSTRNNYNPFGSMFDSGMTSRRKPKSRSGSSTKYVIRGGKAYPIAGSKKKKKSSKRKSSGFGGLNMTDNWGFMK